MKRWIGAGLLVVAVVAMGEPPAATSRGDEASAGKRVTLHCKGASAAAVLDDLCKQMGVTYSTSPAVHDDWPAVTLDVENRPYWEVAGELSKAWGGVNFFPQLGQKLLVFRNQGNRSWDPNYGVQVISVPVMMRASAIRHDVFLDRATVEHECAMSLIFAWEPQLKVAGYRWDPPEEAVDENGRSVVGKRGGEMQYPVYGWYQRGSIALTPGKEAGHKVAKMKGALKLYLLEKAEVVEIVPGDFGKIVTVAVGGATVEVTVRREANNFLFKTVVRGKLEGKERERVEEFLGAIDVEMVDAAGLVAQHGPLAVWPDDPGVLSMMIWPMTAEGKKMGPAVGCRVVVPQVLEELVVPWEFRDLPLP